MKSRKIFVRLPTASQVRRPCHSCVDWRPAVAGLTCIGAGGNLGATMRKARPGAALKKLTHSSPQCVPPTKQGGHSAEVSPSSNWAIFFEQNPEARTAYEKLHRELAAGFARQLKAAERAGRPAAVVSYIATERQIGQPEEMARMAVEGYVTELIKFRNPLLPRHLPPGLSKDLRDLSKSMEVLAKRARRVWNKLPPGLTGGAAALEQWRQDTLKLAKALNEGNWLPKNSGKWNVVDEIIWGLLKLLEQITGRYHYPEVAELATLCLDDPNNRCNVAALKMLVNRRKPRERNFLQAIAKIEEGQANLMSKLTRPRTPLRKRPDKR